jgi:hypothetical protein
MDLLQQKYNTSDVSNMAVRLITLEAYASETVFHTVVDQNCKDHPNPISITPFIDKHLSQYPVSLREFVEVTPDQILIGINTVTIDDFAYAKAQEYLSLLDSFDTNRYEYGDDILFTKSQRHQLKTGTKNYIM